MSLMSIFKQHLKREKFCHQSGLTLLELMLAIAIIGILASLALPSFNRAIQQGRMRLIVDTVISDLREASTLALSAGPGERITLEVANPGASWTYTVSHSSEGALFTRSASDFSGDIALSVTSADFDDSDDDGLRDVQFNKLRSIDNTGSGTFVITSGDLNVQISRNPIGLVSVCSQTLFAGFASCGS
jgi:type IV fimbrial biogenesis protein FimT